MHKRKKGRKLSRKRDQRWALLRGLVEALILKEKIKTSEAKAKEISGLAEKFITRAKKADLSSRKMLGRFFTPKTAKKLISEIAPRYQTRSGGCTRIIKL